MATEIGVRGLVRRDAREEASGWQRRSFSALVAFYFPFLRLVRVLPSAPLLLAPFCAGSDILCCGYTR